MRKLLLLAIFTIGVFSTYSCRDMEELNISEAYANSNVNVKVMNVELVISNKNDSIKIGGSPKDPVKWGVAKDSLDVKK
ncbi:hypothetical protein ACFFUE_10815 [Bergeyella porcorum]|uniref:hypothetical protein n=1 Tax=Bergeyella porcorum TaxID=1735111 RepID=UPI0035E4AB28